MSFGSALLPAVAAVLALAACKPEPTAGTSPATRGEADAVRSATNPAFEPRAGTAAQAVDDAVLSTRVKARLAETDLNVGDINVSSSAGNVTLSGTVPAEQIARADAIVREVDGVTEVINALTAAPLPPAPTTTAPAPSAPPAQTPPS